MNEKAPANIVLTLVGNKIDLDGSSVISPQQHDEVCGAEGLCGKRTSAKSGENVNQLFFDASKCLYTQLRNADFASDS